MGFQHACVYPISVYNSFMTWLCVSEGRAVSSWQRGCFMGFRAEGAGQLEWPLQSAGICLIQTLALFSRPVIAPQWCFCNQRSHWADRPLAEPIVVSHRPRCCWHHHALSSKYFSVLLHRYFSIRFFVHFLLVLFCCFIVGTKSLMFLTIFLLTVLKAIHRISNVSSCPPTSTRQHVRLCVVLFASVCVYGELRWHLFVLGGWDMIGTRTSMPVVLEGKREGFLSNKNVGNTGNLWTVFVQREKQKIWNSLLFWTISRNIWNSKWECQRSECSFWNVVDI